MFGNNFVYLQSKEFGMNIDGLVNKYFQGKNPTIEVFDEQSIHQVYSNVVNLLKACPDVELGVLQLFSYCFYEILDNVVTHSGKNCGTVISQYLSDENTIRLLIVDDGKGIKASLSENEAYKDIVEDEALRKCLQDRVTDGKGMGFGLYSTLCLIRNIGVRLELHSGSHVLVSDGTTERIDKTTQWQGTILFIEIYANKDIEPNAVLLNRVDVADEFNDTFLDSEEFDNLW